MNKADRDWMKKLDGKLDQHVQDIATIKEQNKNISTFVNKMDRRVFGNGQKGLCDEVTEHRTYFKIIGIAVVTVPPSAIVIAEIIKFIFH